MRTKVEVDKDAYRWNMLGAIGVWFAYVWMTTFAGLALHPYKSVRRMVMDKPILLPVVLSPFFGLLFLFIVGRLGSAAFELSGWAREGVALLLGGTLIGLLLWQGLLAALVIRFWRAR